MSLLFTQTQAQFVEHHIHSTDTSIQCSMLIFSNQRSYFDAPSGYFKLYGPTDPAFGVIIMSLPVIIALILLLKPIALVWPFQALLH